MKNIFDQIPYLETERLVLRKLEESDSEDLRGLVENDNVYKYLPTFLIERQYEDTKEAIRNINGKYFEDREGIILGIFDKRTSQFGGLIELYGYKQKLHSIHIGCRLVEEVWKNGIAAEATVVLVDYLLEETDIEIIAASTMANNKGSAKVLEGIGFIKTAEGVEEDWGFDEPVLEYKWFR